MFDDTVPFALKKRFERVQSADVDLRQLLPA
jgi:hypothetical protein